MLVVALLNHIFCVFFFVEGTFRERLPSLMAAIGSKIMALFSHFIFKFSGNGPQCHPHVFHRSVRVGNYAVAWADAGGLRVPSRFRLLVFSLQTHGMLVQVAEEPSAAAVVIEALQLFSLLLALWPTLVICAAVLSCRIGLATNTVFVLTLFLSALPVVPLLRWFRSVFEDALEGRPPN